MDALTLTLGELTLALEDGEDPMTMKKITEKAAFEAAKFECARQMREILDTFLKRAPADQRDEIEEELSELIFGDDE